MQKNFNDFLINSIIFSDKPINIIESFNINNVFLDEISYLLNDFVSTYNNMQSLDDYMIENAYDVIDYIRFNYKYNNLKEKNFKYTFYNNIITKLNSALKINSEAFYLSQIINRQIFIECDFDIDELILSEKVKDEIRHSLCCDKNFYEILSKPNYQIKQYDYSKLVMNKFFLYSVNYFLLECPDILKHNKLLKDILLNNLKETKKLFLDKKDSNIKKYSKKILNNIRW